mmetsp:Transcript_27528/g.53917  ORF Transcript_27528/g.53917 Transcript_27528/m.53917 type:complete len:312 (+) Transcript_27528:185-1120(+)
MHTSTAKLTKVGARNAPVTVALPVPVVVVLDSASALDAASACLSGTLTASGTFSSFADLAARLQRATSPFAAVESEDNTKPVAGFGPQDTPARLGGTGIAASTQWQAKMEGPPSALCQPKWSPSARQSRILRTPSGSTARLASSLSERTDRAAKGLNEKTKAVLALPVVFSSRAGTSVPSSALMRTGLLPGAVTATLFGLSTTPARITSSVWPRLGVRPRLPSFSSNMLRGAPADSFSVPLPSAGRCSQDTVGSKPALRTTYVARTKLRELMPLISRTGGQKSPYSGPTSGDMEIMPCAPYIQSSDSPTAV